MGIQARQRDRANALGQGMLRVHHHADRLGLRGMGADFRVGGRIEHQAQMRLIFHDLAYHLVGSAHIHLNLDLGVQRGKVAERARQPIDETLPHRQDDRAALQPSQCLQRIQQQLLVSQALPVVTEHPITGLRRPYPTSVALQQWAAQLLFQLPYLAADSRWRNVEDISGRSHAAQPDRFEKIKNPPILYLAHGFPVLR